MSTSESKNRTSSDMKDREKAGPFEVLGHYESMWWPYRSFSKALLRTHSNVAAFMEVNRRLADEMREIVRKEQDLVLQMSEKMLQRVALASDVGEAKSLDRPGEMEEIYDSAVAGIRELGKAVADAQIRSIETLRTHARNTIGQPSSGESKPAQAA